MSHGEPIYVDAQPGTFQRGLEFQDFICINLAREGIILQNLASTKYQFTIGENPQGFEIKLDRRHIETGRLSIEIAEKTSAANPTWIPSGIYRDDNSWLYIQGNYERFYIFDKGILRRYHSAKKPKEHTEPTIKAYYLPHPDADKIAAKIISAGGTLKTVGGGP
jgi:hypothetical protein